MVDFSHLDALQGRLYREQERLREAEALLSSAKGRRIAKIKSAIAFRKREIASCEREIAGEYKFLGIDPPPVSLDDISNDELFKALTQ